MVCAKDRRRRFPLSDRLLSAMTASPTFLADPPPERFTSATHDETLPISSLVQPLPQTGQPAPRTSLNGRELERLTGVSLERVRTWRRRFNFPEEIDRSSGKRRFYTGDVPRVVAASQLIASGVPVAEAIERVRAGLPTPDLGHLERGFGALRVPVVAVRGPEPLTLLWANDAARARAELHGTVVAAPSPGSLLYRPLQHFTAGTRAGSAVVQHVDPDDPEAAARSLIWAIGPPAYLPAAAVVILLPPETPEPSSELSEADDRSRQIDDRTWCAALAAARRTLQREAGVAALDAALAQLVDRTSATDAFALLHQSTGFVCARSTRGRVGPSRTTARQYPELADPAGDRPAWFTDAASEHFTGIPGASCLAVPMMSAGRHHGFVVLEFPSKPAFSADTDELLIGFATSVSVSVARDRAQALRRKLAAADGDTAARAQP